MSGPYDLVILGSGTSAFAGALRGAEMGARVLMVEQSHLGGTCVNWGCIPSKTLIHQAETYFEPRRSGPLGLDLRAGPPDCRRIMEAKRRAVETLRRENYQQVLDANPDIDVVRGHGRFISPRELRVGAEILVSDRFLIACGGVPRNLPIPGLAEVGFLTSYSALHLPCFPRSLVIIGGGVIALEMGQMFSRFGTRVTILERGERPLKEFDSRLTGLLRQLVTEEGMTLVFGAETRRAYREGEDACLVAAVDGEERVLRAEQIMVAVGTAPATCDIGLEEAGVKADRSGFILTDAECRTSAPGIFAAGDVTGPPLIAPAGAREAEVAVENMLDSGAHRRIDHRCTPMAVFIDPELAMVGDFPFPKEAALVETYLDLQKVSKAHVMGGRRGAILLCAERETGRIVGVQVLAPRAADVIHEAVLAVRLGLTVYDLAETVHVHPTISEGLRQAALENIRQQGGRAAPAGKKG